mmetsp:Transcript_147621/g.456630  ORF Transcript_147621/g.456630 Transcript_147621/m.456630 type:complete len:229 (+) Transcript_147621:514-1200(+)
MLPGRCVLASNFEQPPERARRGRGAGPLLAGAASSRRLLPLEHGQQVERRLVLPGLLRSTAPATAAAVSSPAPEGLGAPRWPRALGPGTPSSTYGLPRIPLVITIKGNATIVFREVPEVVEGQVRNVERQQLLHEEFAERRRQFRWAGRASAASASRNRSCAYGGQQCLPRLRARLVLRDGGRNNLQRLRVGDGQRRQAGGVSGGACLRRRLPGRAWGFGEGQRALRG